jgi:hypothetical protein
MKTLPTGSTANGSHPGASTIGGSGADGLAELVSSTCQVAHELGEAFADLLPPHALRAP